NVLNESGRQWRVFCDKVMNGLLPVRGKVKNASIKSANPFIIGGIYFNICNVLMGQQFLRNPIVKDHNLLHTLVGCVKEIGRIIKYSQSFNGTYPDLIVIIYRNS